MNDFFAIVVILLLAFSGTIIRVILNKGEHAVQKKMDQRAQRKEDEEQNS